MTIDWASVFWYFSVKFTQGPSIILIRAFSLLLSIPRLLAHAIPFYLKNPYGKKPCSNTNHKIQLWKMAFLVCSMHGRSANWQEKYGRCKLAFFCTYTQMSECFSWLNVPWTQTKRFALLGKMNIKGHKLLRQRIGSESKNKHQSVG